MGVFARRSTAAQQTSMASNFQQQPPAFAGNEQQHGFGGSPFWQPTATSNPQTRTSGFGQTRLDQNGPLGGSSNFGTSSAPPSTFAQPQQPTSFSPFGQQTPGASVALLDNHAQTVPNGPFGGGPQLGGSANTFGQPLTGVFASQQNQIQNQPFSQSQPAAQSNGTTFGNVQNSSGTPFGQPLAQMPNGVFGTSASQQTSTFAQPSLQQSAISSFGQESLQQQTNGLSNHANAPNTTSAPLSNGIEARFQPSSSSRASAPSNPDINTYTIRDARGQLQTWKGQPVSFVDGVPCFRNHNNGGWERIWFPDGQPPLSQSNAAGEAAVIYGAEYSVEEARAAYEFVAQNGAFKDGIMPELPPRPEWVRWDI